MNSRQDASHSTNNGKNVPQKEPLSECCLELEFMMSRFHEYLELPLFTPTEFEEELMKEENNYRAAYTDIYRSLLLTQILEALLSNISKNSKIKDYDHILVIFAQRHFKRNPFGTLTSCDFHTLPTNVKTFVLLEIVQYYCEMEQAQNVDKYRSANELRVVTLGHGSDKYELFYFQDLRLFKKRPAKEFLNRQVPLDESVLMNAPWKETYTEIAHGDHYECIAWSLETWEAVMKKYKNSKSTPDKKMVPQLKSIFESIKDSFDKHYTTYETQKTARTKLAQKIENDNRRSMGLVRTSARLQEKMKTKEENEEGSSGQGTSEETKPNTPIDVKANQKNDRNERHNRREDNRARDVSGNGFELAIDVEKNTSNLSEGKSFESPSPSSPNSLKEVQVSNFRIDKPPISPEQNGRSYDDVFNDEIVVPTAPLFTNPKVKESTPAVEIEQPHPMPQESTRKRKIPYSPKTKTNRFSDPLPQPVNKFPRMNFKLMKNPTNTASPESSSSDSSGAKLPADTPERRAGSVNSDGQVVFFSSVSPCGDAMKRTFRLFRWRFNSVYQDWQRFYYNQPIPEDFRQFQESFPASPEEDTLVTPEKWTQLKMIIFRMPMRLAGIEGSSIRNVPISCQKLALSFMKFIVKAWPLLFHSIGEIDKILIAQTEDNIKIISNLVDSRQAIF